MDLLLNILIFVLVFGAIWYVVSLLPLPHPFGRIVQVVLAVVALVWLLSLLFGLMDVPRVR